jgi:hypothetical protein
MKAKKYNYGGKMEEMGQMAMVKATTLEEAVAQIKAAVKAGSMMPTHYKIKACYYEEDED